MRLIVLEGLYWGSPCFGKLLKQCQLRFHSPADCPRDSSLFPIPVPLKPLELSTETGHGERDPSNGNSTTPYQRVVSARDMIRESGTGTG